MSGLTPDASALIHRKLGFQRGGDLQSHVGLDREDVVELTVVSFGPYMPVVSGINELGDDAHTVAGSTYAPLEQRAYLQRRPDFAQALLAVLEWHHGRAGNHLQGANLGKLRDHVFGDAVGKEFVLGIGAEVPERKHGDRRGTRLLLRWGREGADEVARVGEPVGGSD